MHREDQLSEHMRAEAKRKAKRAIRNWKWMLNALVWQAMRRDAKRMAEAAVGWRRLCGGSGLFEVGVGRRGLLATTTMTVAAAVAA